VLPSYPKRKPPKMPKKQTSLRETAQMPPRIKSGTKRSTCFARRLRSITNTHQISPYSTATNQQFQDAINDYGEAIKITPEDARIYEQRAAVEMKLNDTDKALADYSEAIKLKPNEVRYYGYRSYIYEVKGDIKNSMADTEKVLKLDPKNQEAISRKKRLETLQTMRATPPPPPPAASSKTSPAGAHTSPAGAHTPHKP